jgi:hypothetical protein
MTSILSFDLKPESKEENIQKPPKRIKNFPWRLEFGNLSKTRPMSKKWPQRDAACFRKEGARFEKRS